MLLYIDSSFKKSGLERISNNFTYLKFNSVHKILPLEYKKVSKNLNFKLIILNTFCLFCKQNQLNK